MNAANAIFTALLLASGCVLSPHGALAGNPPASSSVSAPSPAAPTRHPSPPPEVVMLDNVPGCYGAVRFDHRLHVGMSTIQGACSNCHHELPEDLQEAGEPSIRPCRTCHEPTSAAISTDKLGLRGAYHRQCLACHKAWAQENGCGFCHADSAAMRTSPTASRQTMSFLPTRSSPRSTYVYRTANKTMPIVTFHHDDHTKLFGVSCVECHGGNSCSQCHGSGAERPIINRQQTCYKCHAESRCVTCHNLGESAGFEHELRTGWKLRPGHAQLACAACHEVGRAGPNDPSLPPPQAAFAMPSRPASDACRACHAKRWSDADFDHGRTGVALNGDHAYFSCLDCHSGGDDRMTARCSSCHTERPVDGSRWVGPKAQLSRN